MILSPANQRQLDELFADQDRLLTLLDRKDFTKQSRDWILSLERKWIRYPSLYEMIDESISQAKRHLSHYWKNEEETAHPERRGKRCSSPDSQEEIERQQPQLRQEKYLEGKAPRTAATLFIPTEQNIRLFYESQGLIGEEATRELLLYAALGKVHTGIESLSGGGKSFLLNRFLKALPEGSYEAIQQISEKALFNDLPGYKKVEVNNRMVYRKEMKYLVATEYQKVINNHFLEEVVKNIAEGEPSTYIKTNKSGNGTDHFELLAACVMYTYAINNPQAKNKRQNAEMARRFLILHTDISTEHIDQVRSEQSERDFKSPLEFDPGYFKRHMNQCLSRDDEIINPFLPYLEEILPSRLKANIKRLSFMPYLEKLIGGCTLFHYAERSAEGKNLFATIYDTAHTLSLDQNLIENNIQGLSVVERHILDTMETEREYSPEEISGFLPVFDRKQTVVEEALTYLQEELQQLQLTSSGTYIKKQEERVMFDLNKAYESARNYMEGQYPAVAEEWKKTCLQELEELL